MQITSREKIEALRRIKSTGINLSEVSYNLEKYNGYLLRRIYMKKLIGTLVEHDCYISAAYEMMSEDEWMTITSRYDTPVENYSNKKIKDKIENLINGIVSLYDTITVTDFDFVIEMLDRYVLLVKSRNLQFLLFKLLELNEEDTLMFFVEKIRNTKINLQFYLSFFVTIIIRYRLKKNVETAAIKMFISQILNNKDTNGIHYLHSLQLLLYMCCFKHELIKDLEIYKIIDDAYQNLNFKKLNKIVVEIFCSVFCEYKCPLYFETIDNDIFNFFPLDPSILPIINDKMNSKYVEWSKV